MGVGPGYKRPERESREPTAESRGQRAEGKEQSKGRRVQKKEPGAELFSPRLSALSSYCEATYACSPLGATDVRPQSSHVR